MTRKKVGLALSGGGARGFAHIGVLKVLVENGIPIDMIAGTSAGSIVGGAFAAGMSIDDIVELAGKVRYSNIMLPTVAMGGMFTNAPMGRFLKEHLSVSKIEDMPLPFTAVAFDLAKNEVVHLTSGDLVTAIRASSAVPGVFAPVRHADGRRLVDGGVVTVMPVQVVREMGADIVIGVDLLRCGSAFRKGPQTSVGIMVRSTMAMLRTAIARDGERADLVIEPAIAHLRMDQIGKRDEFIALGEEAARTRIAEINDLIGL